MNQPLVLQNQTFIVARNSGFMLTGAMALLFILLALSILLILDKPLDAETLSRLMAALQQQLLKAFHEAPVESSINALVFLSLPVFLLYMHLAGRNERLILTPTGIRYVSPFSGSFEFLRPGWFLRWSQVTHGRLDRSRFGLDAGLSTLTLTTTTGVRRLRPYFWVNPQTWKPVMKRRFGIPVKPDAAERLESIVNGELVTYIRDHVPGMDMNIGDGAAGKQPFRLEDNPWTGGMTVLLLVLLGYALVDSFIVKTEVFAGRPPLGVYVAGGLLAAVAAAALLFRERLPVYVCILLSAMIGTAFAAASHPALLRINQWTDETGLDDYVYVRQPDGVYRPENPALPSLSMDYPADYWAQFRPGSKYAFALRKGGLGFWQLSEVPLRDAYLEYYEAQRKTQRGR
jgi:hypothetical protein